MEIFFKHELNGIWVAEERAPLRKKREKNLLSIVLTEAFPTVEDDEYGFQLQKNNVLLCMLGSLVGRHNNMRTNRLKKERAEWTISNKIFFTIGRMDRQFGEK